MGSSDFVSITDSEKGQCPCEPSSMTARHGGHRCLHVEVTPKKQDGSVALYLHLAHGSWLVAGGDVGTRLAGQDT